MTTITLVKTHPLFSECPRETTLTVVPSPGPIPYTVGMDAGLALCVADVRGAWHHQLLALVWEIRSEGTRMVCALPYAWH